MLGRPGKDNRASHLACSHPPFPPAAKTFPVCGIIELAWKRNRPLGSVIGLCLFSLLPIRGSEGDDQAQREAAFVREVLPLLQIHCFDCHSHQSGESSGQLMLDSLTAMTTGGTRGASIVPGKPSESLLIRAVEYEDVDLQMPPDGPLSAADVKTLRAWISDGAHVPSSMRGQVSVATSQQPKADDHWAYQPPQPWEAPEGGGRYRGKLDPILIASLREVGLSFSPRADRATLARRLSYDLRGLPPTPDEVQQFLDDPQPDFLAMERLVDRWLASPRFGERWARYWMDVARYADNKGYVFREDREYPGAYQYRDWLIAAFNQDLPYDQFVSQQLAADLLAEKGDASQLPALGFLTLGRRFLNNKYDIIDDRLDVVSRGLMGMTLACARCHDHKYDPLSQADYYALSGVFLNTDEPGGEPWPHRLQDTEKNRDSFILVRGSPGNRGERVERRFVRFLAPEAKAFTQGSGRVELAGHIVAANNPLTARVMANRVWMRLTGGSLVDSPSDLGIRCPPPRQLALLDQLAIELVSGGWSVKSLIREIVLSDFYAQQSLERPEAVAIDPANRLYWKMNRRRLDFEALRDTLLSQTGNLDGAMYGKSEEIHAPPFSQRRTVYAYIDRQNLPSVFRTFDMATPDVHSPKRAETSVPQQGLFLLNSDFVAEQANRLAGRLRALATSESRGKAVDRLFETVLARKPSLNEQAWFEEFLETQAPLVAPEPQQRWLVGYATFLSEDKTIRDFQRLPHWADGRWQGGAELPDDAIGWCMLNDRGGHPGNDLEHAVVRRWVAPRSGRIKITGRLKHPADKGDGVRGTILVNGSGAGSWTVHQGSASTSTKLMNVEQGQWVDFVTDCIGSPSHDSFEWIVTLTYETGTPRRFESSQELPGPLKERLDPWAQAVQALLLSNELAFVD